MLTLLSNLCKWTVEDIILMNPLLITLEASNVELQKNKALFSLKGSSFGMKLKLHFFAIAIAIAISSRSGLCSVQSHITACSQIDGCGLPSILRMETMESDQGLSL